MLGRGNGAARARLGAARAVAIAAQTFSRRRAAARVVDARRAARDDAFGALAAAAWLDVGVDDVEFDEDEEVPADRERPDGDADFAWLVMPRPPAGCTVRNVRDAAAVLPRLQLEFEPWDWERGVEQPHLPH